MNCGEFLGIIEGVYTAKIMGLYHVIMKNDSLNVVNKLKAMEIDQFFFIFI